MRDHGLVSWEEARELLGIPPAAPVEPEPEEPILEDGIFIQKVARSEHLTEIVVSDRVLGELLGPGWRPFYGCPTISLKHLPDGRFTLMVSTPLQGASAEH